MRVFALSDLHLSNACDKPMDIFGGNWENYTEKIREKWTAKVKPDDLVLIAGDISWGMRLEEAKSDLDWIDSLPGKKIIIKGNHEYWWKSISAVRQILPSSILAIQNDALRINNLVICGTRGWDVPEKNRQQSAEDEKIFKREVERLKLTLTYASSLMQEGDRLICMIHFPPYCYDKSGTEFTDLFEKFGVRDVVFGHIHGKTTCPKFLVKNGINYYLTSCDQIDNDPVLICED